MTYCYLDTETVGLSLLHHDIWELAYVFDDEAVRTAFVPHSLVGAEPNGYHQRYNDMPGRGLFEMELRERMELEKPTIVGANPAFDTYRLSRRWGWAAPWRYRMIDVESMALPIFGWDTPRGLVDISDALVGEGFDIPMPNHSAADDVECVRAVHKALVEMGRDRSDALAEMKNA
jgi:hypothetical protein